MVAGGKYTTHRQMAKEIIDFAVDDWPRRLRPSRTAEPVNPQATVTAIEACRAEARQKGIALPEDLVGRYGAEALEMAEEAKKNFQERAADPEGFPHLAAQLRHAIRTGMVLHLEDFYLRRVPLFLARRDHGIPWAEALSHVWAQESGKGEADRIAEVERLKMEVEKRSAWMRNFK